tara:strand:- start:178 stop:594 length:417 start_codon:yes stop_codon:yes gene_type:complete
MPIIEVKNVFVSVLALVNQDNKVLICKRSEKKDFPGLWEFPGGKLKNNECPENALIREVKEELNINLEQSCIAPVTFSSSSYKSYNLIIFLYVARKWQNDLKLNVHQEMRWIKANQLRNYKMPPANKFLISGLQDLIL